MYISSIKKSSQAKKPESENELRLRVAGYLKKVADEHSIMYRFDLAGLYTDQKEARILIKKLNGNFAGFPDLQIIKPNGRYIGMFIELKREGTTRRSLLSPTTTHGKQQLAMLKRLQKMGFAACFGIGFHGVKQKIIQYIHRKQVTLI